MPPRGAKNRDTTTEAPSGAAGGSNMDVNEPAAANEANVAAIGAKRSEVSEIVRPFALAHSGDEIVFEELPEEGWAQLEALLGFRPTAAEFMQASGGDLHLTASRDTPADSVAAAAAAAADAGRLDPSDVRQLDADLSRTAPATGVGAALPAGIGETSLEPGASMPAIAATRTAEIEAIVDRVVPPRRSPVFPAGADPAGAILEGRAGNVQSAPRPSLDAWLREVDGDRRSATVEEKDGGPVRITAKRVGFRRCGIAHSVKPVDYPAGYWSMTEIVEMEGEPNLFVVRLPWQREADD